MDPQPAASPPVSSLWLRNKKVLLIGGGILFVVAYMGFNFAVWRYAINSKISRTSATADKTGTVGETAPTEVPPTPSNTPTPTPRPTGPGQYACSPIGTCKDYSDEVRKAKCTVTYADRLCLDKCADSTKWCKP